MNAFLDRACDEIRWEEPVTLEGPVPHEIPTALILKKTETPSIAEATRPLLLGFVSSDRSLDDSTQVKHNEPLLANTTMHSLAALGTHALALQTEDYLQSTQARESSTGSPRSIPRFFFNPGSPASSNSSDGSSLFGSPKALSTGARSTSSDYYGCDSTSSSREVFPFGSPSSGAFPLFRFAFPNDAR